MVLPLATGGEGFWPEESSGSHPANSTSNVGVQELEPFQTPHHHNHEAVISESAFSTSSDRSAGPSTSQHAAMQQVNLKSLLHV